MPLHWALPRAALYLQRYGTNSFPVLSSPMALAAFVAADVNGLHLPARSRKDMSRRKLSALIARPKDRPRADMRSASARSELPKFTPFNFIGDGLDLPITNMLDIYGEETCDPEEAVSIVAPLPSGEWLACECQPHEIVRRIVA